MMLMNLIFHTRSPVIWTHLLGTGLGKHRFWRKRSIGLCGCTTGWQIIGWWTFQMLFFQVHLILLFVLPWKNGPLRLEIRTKVVLDFGSTQENVVNSYIICLKNKILIGGYSNLSPNTRSCCQIVWKTGGLIHHLQIRGVLSFKYGRSTGMGKHGFTGRWQICFWMHWSRDTLDVDFLVTRFSSDGQIDTSFNHTDGLIMILWLVKTFHLDMFVQDHKIFLSGCSVCIRKPILLLSDIMKTEVWILVWYQRKCKRISAGNQDVAHSSIIQEPRKFYTSGTVRDSIN